MNKNGKMKPVENILKMGPGGGIKENDGEVNLMMIFL
jgi:hypothetical protein